MNQRGEVTLAVILLLGLMSGIFGLGLANKVSQDRKIEAITNQIGEKIVLGAFTQAGGLTYRLQSSAGTTDTSITLSSMKNRSDIPLTMTVLNTDIGYGTLSPQTTRSEFISFTGITQNANGTAQLTGVTRGLSDVYPFTASSTLRESHPGQSIFILSDSPQLFEEYGRLRSAQSWTGINTYSSTSQPVYDGTPATVVNPLQLAHIGLVNGIVATGCVNATSTNLVLVTGCVKIGTSTDYSYNASSTVVLVQDQKHASSTPGVVGVGGSLSDVWTTSSGTIALGFFDQTATYPLFSVIASSSIIGSSTSNLLQTGNLTATGTLKLNGVSYTMPVSDGSASSTLTTNGAGQLVWEYPGGTLDTFIPKPLSATTTADLAIGANTTASCGLFNMPQRMTIATTTIQIASAGTPGTVDVGIYRIDSSSLATKINDITSTLISTGRFVSITDETPLSINGGNYYICIVANGTANVAPVFWGGVFAIETEIATEPMQSGTLTVTAGTLPDSFNPTTNLTYASTRALLLVRFDGN